MNRYLAVAIAPISILALGVLGSVEAQSQVDPIAEILKACGSTTELNYHSQKLTFPARNMTVYVDAVLRRIKVDGERIINSYCSENGEAQTPVRKIVIETSNNKKVLEWEAFNNAYLVDTPVSFSPGGEYIAIQTKYAYPGSEVGIELFIADLNQAKTFLNVCEKTRNPNEPYYVEEFKGFIAESQAVTVCMGGNWGEETPWIEVLDLNSGKASRVSVQQATASNAAIYGSVLEPLTIVNQQLF